MVRRVIFMRHGQSEYNLHVQGDCESECGEDPLIRDAGLTALGCAQAEGRVAKRRGRHSRPGQRPACSAPEDLNDDGWVSQIDLGMLLGSWGLCSN